jgi:hypothetical protein
MGRRELTVQDKAIVIAGTWLKTASLTDEWHESVEDPESVVQELRDAGANADLFTFRQRFPDIQPRFEYHREAEEIAVLPVTTYEHWLKRQINNKTRNLIAKAAKKNVIVRRSQFDSAFVAGMTEIFNETPVRQGMPFWHYGKAHDVVQREFSRFLFREEVFGAYVNDQMIGFMFVVDGGSFAMLGQILSMVKHRDKATNNALIAKAVEFCAERQIPALIYAMWPREGSLRDFKRHNAFESVTLPRYHIPLTMRGRVALKLGIHRAPSAYLPDSVLEYARARRSRLYSLWYSRRTPA